MNHRSTGLFLSVMLLVGCSSTFYNKKVSARGVGGGYVAASLAGEPDQNTQVQSDRMLVWKASLSVEVWNVSNAMAQASAAVEQAGGRVERKSDRGQDFAHIVVRVPVASFRKTLTSLESIGTVISKEVSAEDVTEQYIDVEARLKNKLVLRDRLKQLLDKATDVKDVLAIETELNRVQADIDSMEGRIKVLHGQVDLATIELSFEKKKVLGPLGYVGKGVWWAISHLFVLSD